MATHPSTPASKIPWTEVPGGLQSRWSQKSQTWLSMHTNTHTHIHTHTHTHTFLEKLSCTSYISSIFMLASGHPGLKIKISYYCTPYSSVQQSTQKHNLLYRMHTWQCTLDTWTDLRDRTCEHPFTSLKVCNLKACMEGTYCMSGDKNCQLHFSSEDSETWREEWLPRVTLPTNNTASLNPE